MAYQEVNQEALKKLKQEIHGIRFAMLTTLDQDGALSSRPMTTQEMQPDGTLWFFTEANSPKVANLQGNNRVNLSYVKEDDNRFVSVEGMAELVRDQQKVRQLWNPLYKAWFPKGENDPELALLKVVVTGAEYWDASSNKMVELFHIAQAAVTGQPGKTGDNQKLNVR